MRCFWYFNNVQAPFPAKLINAPSDIQKPVRNAIIINKKIAPFGKSWKKIMQRINQGFIQVTVIIDKGVLAAFQTWKNVRNIPLNNVCSPKVIENIIYFCERNISKLILELRRNVSPSVSMKVRHLPLDKLV